LHGADENYHFVVQRLQLIALRSDPRARVALTQVSIEISSTFFFDGAQ
jgi:hypothetical protein